VQGLPAAVLLGACTWALLNVHGQGPRAEDQSLALDTVALVSAGCGDDTEQTTPNGKHPRFQWTASDPASHSTLDF